MQIRCPSCRALLEIPEPPVGTDVFHVECGACQKRFKLQLNRPSLRFRKPFPTGRFRKSSRPTTPEEEELSGILITGGDALTGRKISERLSEVTSEEDLPEDSKQRENEMLDKLTTAQLALRKEARALGADGVVSVKMDTIGAPDKPRLRLQGVAVKLHPIEPSPS